MKCFGLLEKVKFSSISALCVFVPFQLYSAKYPNVILILADDLGYGDVGIMNSTSKIRTPNLDRLSECGVVFTDAHSASSVSTPSRYSLLTGEYSWKSSLKSGVLFGHSRHLIPSGKSTIASMMKKNGYRTACIGKWHLGMDWATTDGRPANKKCSNIDYNGKLTFTPTSNGFDYFYGIAASLDIPPYVIVENDSVPVKPDGYYEMTTFTERDDEIGRNPFLRAGAYIKGFTPEMYLPEFTSKVIEKIDEYADGDSPFFIYFPLNAPHAPIVPSEHFVGKSGIGRYGDFVMEIDDVVGKVINKLEEENVLDNTIIIFSSDNGPEYFAYHRYPDTGHDSAGGFKGIKRDLWEGGHRVPLIISCPSLFGKRVVDQTVSLCDIYATLAGVVKYVKDDSEAEDSYSLLPLISGKGEYGREFTVHHSGSGRFAIRKGDWVLIEYGSGNDNNSKPDKTDYYGLRGYRHYDRKVNGELYNLSTDVKEFRNMYNERIDIVRELSGYLDRCTHGYMTKRDVYLKKRK